MSQEKFKIRTRTQILFGLMFALLLGAVLLRFNFANAQVRLLLQVGLILLVMVLGLLEIHRINRGLQRLAKVAELIGQGAFEARAESGTRDALGLVGKAINTMAGQIESSIQERERSQAELVKSKEALDRQNEQLSIAFDRQARFGEFLADLASIEINTLANKSLSHLMAVAQAQLGRFYLFDETTRRLVCLNAQGWTVRRSNISLKRTTLMGCRAKFSRNKSGCSWNRAKRACCRPSIWGARKPRCDAFWHSAIVSRNGLGWWCWPA